MRSPQLNSINNPQPVRLDRGNSIPYAEESSIILKTVKGTNGARGLTIVSTHSGPGTDDVAQALGDDYSRSGGLGLGLPGVRRLMDEFNIDSSTGTGTTITVTKWGL